MTDWEHQLQRDILQSHDKTCSMCKDKATAMHVYYKHNIKLHEYAIAMCEPCYRIQQTIDTLKEALKAAYPNANAN
jgi:hypothetical protein